MAVDDSSFRGRISFRFPEFFQAVSVYLFGLHSFDGIDSYGQENLLSSQERKSSPLCSKIWKLADLLLAHLGCNLYSLDAFLRHTKHFSTASDLIFRSGFIFRQNR